MEYQTPRITHVTQRSQLQAQKRLKNQLLQSSNPGIVPALICNNFSNGRVGDIDLLNYLLVETRKLKLARLIYLILVVAGRTRGQYQRRD